MPIPRRATSCAPSSRAATRWSSASSGHAWRAGRSTGRRSGSKPSKGSDHMPDVNPIGVLLCGISSMVLGALWYSPWLFASAWQREVGLSDEQLQGANMGKIYGLAFLLSLIAAYVFAMFLGHDMGLLAATGA